LQINPSSNRQRNGHYKSVYVKKTYQFMTQCKDNVMYQYTKTKIFSVTLDGVMHGASLQGDSS